MRNMFSEKINNKYFKPLLKTAVVMLALMAVVVLGGLLTSTLLNIYVIPIVYRWLQKNRA